MIGINEATNTAAKCTLCYDRMQAGMVPACAQACPTASIQFGPIAELRRRAREEGGGLPAVAVSAFARPEDRDRALAAGFHRYLAKPVDVLELVAVVAALYRERGA